MEVFKQKKFIVLVILILISAFTYVCAKYFNNYQENSLYTSEDFYFNSDNLKKDGITYTYQKGVTSITFKLTNNEDTLRYTKSDIDYEVTITNVALENVTTILDEPVETKTGTIKGGKINSDTITFTDLKTGTYKVEAKSTSPYTYNLSATFVITEKDDNISYEISDDKGSTILFLTISDNDYKGSIYLTIPDGLYPDNTMSVFNNVDLNNSRKVKLEFKENSSYTYKFFKEDPASLYTKDDFLIEGE